MAPVVRVIGAARVSAALRQIGADLKNLTALNRRISTAVLPIYQRHLPARSGRLRRSAKAGATRRAALVRIGGSLPYARVITYGWPAHHIEPHRWDVASEPEAGPVAVRLYEDELRGIIRRNGAAP